jgi:hypothetical protein
VSKATKNINVVDPYPGTVSILKRQIDLMEALATYVRFVPTPKQMDDFELDGTRLHPTLLRDAIIEAAQTKLDRLQSPEQCRRLIHQIYARKTKEMAALWPMVFATENAYRAALTEHYHSHFRERVWWRKIENGIKVNGSTFQLRNINGVPINLNFSIALIDMVDGIMSNRDIYPEISKPENESRFFHYLTFGQLIQFFSHDWAGVSGIFSNTQVKGQKISRSSVLRDLSNIRRVRNQIYHSNPVKNTGAFHKSVEGLLLALDICAHRFDDDLKNASYTRPRFVALTGGRIPAA